MGSRAKIKQDRERRGAGGVPSGGDPPKATIQLWTLIISGKCGLKFFSAKGIMRTVLFKATEIDGGKEASYAISRRRENSAH